jgi:hypothetical protein
MHASFILFLSCGADPDLTHVQNILGLFLFAFVLSFALFFLLSSSAQ